MPGPASHRGLRRCSNRAPLGPRPRRAWPWTFTVAAPLGGLSDHYIAASPSSASQRGVSLNAYGTTAAVARPAVTGANQTEWHRPAAVHGG